MALAYARDYSAVPCGHRRIGQTSYAAFKSRDGVIFFMKNMSPDGFEPSTPALKGQCSTRLSYGLSEHYNFLALPNFSRNINRLDLLLLRRALARALGQPTFRENAYFILRESRFLFAEATRLLEK